MNFRGILRTAPAFAALTLLTAFGAAAQDASHPAKPGEMIIKFKPNASAADRAAVLRDLGADLVSPLPNIGASHAHISAATVDEAVRRYRGHAKVEFIEPNYIYRTQVVPNDPRFAEMWQLQNLEQTRGTSGADIRAPYAWNVTNGSVTLLIAITDTGIDYNHPDLAANMFTNPGEIPNNGLDDDGNGFVDDVHGYDFANDDGDPFDDHGHGTHVSGTIGAVGNNGIGTVGVNWQVRLLGCKFLSAAGTGSTDAAVHAIDYAVRMGAKVINASWAGGSASEALRQAIENAGQAGAVFVAAAGNAGLNIDQFPTYPASYDVASLIAVAASDHNDHRPSWSNYGVGSVDLAAPGDNILSTLPGGNYGWLSGTSMAAPHVSGVLGLILSRFPNIGALDAKAVLLARVDPAPVFQNLVLTGGRLNGALAVSDPDLEPPGPVENLTVIDVNGSRATLQWNAPGDDALVGTAARYDLRYSTTPIDDANFATATPATGVPPPSPAGSPQTFTLKGLSFNTTYYLTIKAADEFGNLSPLSTVATATTFGPPAISITPGQLSASLLTAQQTTAELTLSNSGPSELNIRIRPHSGDVVPTGATPARVFTLAPALASSDAVTVSRPPTESVPRPYPLGTIPYSHGHVGARGPLLPADIRIGNAQAPNLRVLILHSGGNVSEIRSLLAAFPNLGTLDVRDAGAGIPTLGELSVYQSVLVVVNDAFPDPGAIGDVLADYVDSGGGVVMSLASFISGWDVRGRLRSQGYVPFTIGSGPAGPSNLGAFDPNHPIMRDVQAVNGDLLGLVGITPGANLIASWSNGQPFVATKGSVAAVNIFVGVRGLWTGDVPLVLHNALVWSAGLRWLSAVPDEAVIPAGGQIGVVVTFDATDLDGGDYAGVLAVTSDDPLRSTIDLSATLHVTGVPDIAVLGETVSVEAFQDYVVNGAITQRSLAATTTPSGDGAFDLEANGDFGDFNHYATLFAEGVSLGMVGATGVGCTRARATFPVPAMLLTSLLADGKVDVEVRNTPDVDALCLVNRHTLRLRYRGPYDRLDFGGIFPGASHELSLLIRNTGTQALVVSAIAANQPAFQPGESNFILGPRSSRMLAVRFHPDQAVAYQGVLTIQSDDPDEGTILIQLQGQGLVPPDVDVEPTAFQETLVSGASVQRTFTIRNQGGSDLDFSFTVEDLMVSMVPYWPGPRTEIDRDPSPPPDPSAGITVVTGTGIVTAPGQGVPGALEYGDVGTYQAPAGFHPGSSASFRLAGATMLLIQDSQPWGTASNEMALQTHQIAFDVIPTALLAGTDLRPYKKVIVAGDQPTSAYETLASRMTQLNDYVSRGGVLEFHAAGWGFSGGDASLVTLPGGMRIHQDRAAVNQVVAPNHPLVAGMPALFTGTFASHGIFTGVPPNAQVLVAAGAGQPVYVVYPVGVGMVIASANTLEHGYAAGNTVGRLLHNSIPYGTQALVGWLSAAPIAGRVPAGGTAQVTVQFRSENLLGGDYDAQLVLRTNDPDEAEVRAPARLHVDSTPDIAIAGPDTSIQSVKAYFASGDVTTHDLVLPFPSSGDGVVDLLAEGDYGDFIETATLEIEGLRLADVGRTGRDCLPADGQFVLAVADLARVAADGVVKVTVTNSSAVDAFCPANRHTVKVRYSRSSDTVDFGDVFTVSSRTLPVRILNHGLEVLQVSAMVSSDPAFEVGVSEGLAVAPGASHVVPITFRPTSPTAYQALLTIRSDDPDEPSLEVRLLGQGLMAPQIAVTPSRVGEHLFSGQAVRRSLTVHNTGGSDLILEVSASASGTAGMARTPAGVRAVTRAPAIARTVVPSVSKPAGSVAAKGGPSTPTTEVVTGEGVPSRSDVAPPYYRPPVAPSSSMAGAHVLLVEDTFPWGTTANEFLLNLNRIAYTTRSTAFLATTELSSYSKVIIAGDQTTDSYLRIQAAMARIVDYVSGGGVLEFHAAGFGRAGGDATLVTLPAGVGIQASSSSVNHVLDPAHPLMVGVPNPIRGTFASHVKFTGVPPTAQQIASDDSGGVNLIVYSHGQGTVIASGQALEFGYLAGQGAGIVLSNLIPFASGGTPPWLTVDPLEGRVPPGTSANLELRLDAAGLPGGTYDASVSLRSNDPDETEITVPVHFAVTSAPDIDVQGPRAVLESLRSFATNAAVTLHDLPVSVAPAGGGTLQLTADGDFGGVFETATAYLEGVRIGEVGRIGEDCDPVVRDFPIDAALLAAAVVDGQIRVEIANTFEVDAFCEDNAHRIRVVYHGPLDPLNFGSPYVGQCRGLEVTVANHGTEVLHLQPPVVTGPAFHAVLPEASSTDVPPGESRPVSVTFCPLAGGAVDAQLFIRSDDPDKPEWVVRLTGVGVVPPDIAVAPGAIDEALLKGQQGARHLMIANGGGSPLTFRVEVRTAPDSSSAARPARVAMPATPLSTETTAAVRMRYREAAPAAGAPAIQPEALPRGRMRAPSPALQAPTEPTNGVVIFFDDMENGANGWTHSALDTSEVDQWSMTSLRKSSGSTSWRVVPHFTMGADALRSPVIDLRGHAQVRLTFQTWYAFDECGGSLDFEPDGVVVEVAEEGSNVWTQIAPVNGYPYTLDDICGNPLAFRQAYTHKSLAGDAFATETFDLTPYAGKRVHLRLHAGWDCGNCQLPDGWFVDDVKVFSDPPTWMQARPREGTLGVGEVADIGLVFDATSLSPGKHDAILNVRSNDPDESSVEIPLRLTVPDFEIAIDLKPNTINLRRRGQWMTGYLELPAGINPVDVDISRVLLNHVAPADPAVHAIGNADRDGVADLMLKFRLDQVRPTLSPGDAVPVVVTGALLDGRTFLGVQNIRVIQHQLLSPNGGEVLTVGSPISVDWRLPPDWRDVTATLQYSRDGGISWNTMASGIVATSYVWHLPAAPSRRMLVRVDVSDGTGVLASDVSDRMFEIRSIVTSIDPAVLPLAPFGLRAAPNPFTSNGLEISFALPSAGDVELSVFSSAGRRVRVLVHEVRAAGPQQFHWDGRDGSGTRLPSGIYFLRLKAAGGQRTHRVALVH